MTITDDSSKTGFIRARFTFEANREGRLYCDHETSYRLLVASRALGMCDHLMSVPPSLITSTFFLQFDQL